MQLYTPLNILPYNNYYTDKIRYIYHIRLSSNIVC